MKIVVVGGTALLLSLSGPSVWAEQRIDVSQVIDSTEAAKILAQPVKDPTLKEMYFDDWPTRIHRRRDCTGEGEARCPKKSWHILKERPAIVDR